MACSSGSNNSSSTMAPDPVLAILDAAKQLSSIWMTDPHAKLLQRPPAAAWGGKAAAAVDHSTALLRALDAGLTQHCSCDDTAASADQLLKGLQQHQLGSMLARLIVWLQQCQEIRLEQPAGSSSSSSSSARGLWLGCMNCLSSLSAFIAGSCKSKSQSTSVLGLHYMEHLTAALDEAGRQEGGSDSCTALRSMPCTVAAVVWCC
jgi:hypothetical protein